MITAAWAQAGPGGAPPALMQFAPLVLIFVVFYFLLIRPQQKRAKDHRSLLGNLKEGDQVMTSGGIYGRITGIREDKVTLEISDKVRVKVSRGHISGVVKGDV